MKRVGLELSPNFTLEDIRKIRDYDYEMTKDMTHEETSAYYQERCDEGMKWYNDFLAKKQAQQHIAAEPVEPYISRSPKAAKHFSNPVYAA